MSTVYQGVAAEWDDHGDLCMVFYVCRPGAPEFFIAARNEVAYPGAFATRAAAEAAIRLDDDEAIGALRQRANARAGGVNRLITEQDIAEVTA